MRTGSRVPIFNSGLDTCFFTFIYNVYIKSVMVINTEEHLSLARFGMTMTCFHVLLIIGLMCFDIGAVAKKMLGHFGLAGKS